MTARMRRLASDWEQVKKDFAGNKHIIVTPVGTEPPERYHVTYFVSGIYLLPDGQVQPLARHEVDITLHSEYPRYKPICTIQTPIWHPNFRDGQICIGDIWGAGESLSDIIVNIGHMIQYKSWNAYSPLCADAAQWAMENKHLFPVGNIDLYIADYASAKDTVQIDLFGEEEPEAAQAPAEAKVPVEAEAAAPVEEDDGNDFEITAEELAGIPFIPTAQRMQTVSHGGTLKGGKINFKTILVKGLLWALIGSILAFGMGELFDTIIGQDTIARIYGYTYMAKYLQTQEKADAAWEEAYVEFEEYCAQNGIDPGAEDSFMNWFYDGASDAALDSLEKFLDYDERANEEFYKSYEYDFDGNEDALSKGIDKVLRTDTALWSAVLALFIGLALGVGEGVFYGSKEKALMYAVVGACVSMIIGCFSGYIAQWMYSELLEDDASQFVASVVRGIGWAFMGLGIGVGAGLIKPEAKRIAFCTLGGLAGGFIGGFLFNYVIDIIPHDFVARGVAIVIMGALIGIGVGLLEQFAKQAWLKVIRGEFEGKEYLVFSGTTSIGNSGKNTIVLFKDKLVAPHHCDIKQDGSKFILIDCRSPMGTVVNGQRISRHVLRRGDTIAIGNSVLVFNTK